VFIEAIPPPPPHETRVEEVVAPSSPLIQVDPKPPLAVNIVWPYIVPAVAVQLPQLPAPPTPIVKSITLPLVAGMVIFSKAPLPPPPPPAHAPSEPVPPDEPPPPPPMASIVNVVTFEGTV